jgi:hypothetical protein
MYTTVYELDSNRLWDAYLAPSGSTGFVVLLAFGVACAIATIIWRRPVLLVGLLPFVLVTSFFGPPLVHEYEWGRSLLDAYTSGSCSTAEGRVHVLAQQRREGHSIDRIDVGGVRLEVSHFELGPQYRDSIVYGGALKEDVEAKVWYCPKQAYAGNGGPIVRVDVKPHSVDTRNIPAKARRSSDTGISETNAAAPRIRR